MSVIDKVIKIAENEVGYLEKRTNAQLDSKTANAGYNNYTKYGRDMHKIYPSVMDFPAPWCDCFVDWCFYVAYGISTAKSLLGGNFDDYTVASAQMYKNKGAYYKSSPKHGDQIFFRNSTRICHTGLVYKVDNNYVYTIEGNTSAGSEVIPNGGGVFKKKYSLNNPRIDGYGRPNYNLVVETTSNTSTPTVKPIVVIDPVKELIKKGQQSANKFADCGLIIDGIVGTNTVKAKSKVLQHAMNLDYRAGIVEDSIFGDKSKKALGNHYVEYGETQYMVTALEILCYLNGKDPKGVEYPGIYGNGLKNVMGYKVTANKFLELIR